MVSVRELDELDFRVLCVVLLQVCEELFIITGVDCGRYVASESAVALEEQETFVLPEEMDYASIVEGILQVTPDIEEELAAADRGETVSMDKFKTMFAQWLD